VIRNSGVARDGSGWRGSHRNKWSRSHCTDDRHAAWNGRYATAWSVRYEHEVEVGAATFGAGQVSDHHLCPRCLREDGEPTASLGLVLIRQSRKTLYLDGGRLLVAPTDWRILCTHYPFNFGSVAAVDASYFVLRTRGTDSASRARRRGRKVERKNRASNGCV